MRKALVPAGLFLLLPWALWAQTPQAEVFGGYSFFRIEQINHHGWNVSLTGNINPNLGWVGDFGGHYGSDSFTSVIGNIKEKLSFHTFLTGPRVSDRSLKWFTPFAHLLLGYARINQEISNVGTPATTFTENIHLNGFGLVAGGGLDITGDLPLSWRVIQADYLVLRAEDVRHEGLRLTTGIVFRLGQRED